MKKVLKYLEENDRAAEIEEFKANINGVMKDLMGRFKDLQFFSGKTQIYLFEYSKLSVHRSFDNQDLELKGAFIQKVLMLSKYPYMDEPNCFHELNILN